MALTRGTLFPGLDLPFLDQVNSGNPYAGTPLGELMALDFVYHEMHLYLDTHPEDENALAYFRRYREVYDRAAAAYTAAVGPLTALQNEGDRWKWADGPCPWERAANA